ncbi:deoxyribose-phosphate aldolase [Methanobrevibacter olleyae]|uniref:Deoxyribose-phosphate aldolase n=2 Tax=Methanobrevibacter olleyae TaxID=294671 RepID=A0A126R013_METOL|nr:deoxyribose-phosphate aldolase DeoC [Methanobrevibacter olleyae]SFL22520.1 deoxyribose-phosphate aldolase [Methanobrevibacter olleyae]
MINKAKKLSKVIEFTNLDNSATIEEMKAFFDKAKEYGFYSVVVLPHYVKLAKEELKDTDIKVVTVVDFPLGAGNTEGKIAESKKAIADGADEIDMMANIPAIKNHDFESVKNDIKSVKEAIGDKVLKVIIENTLLTVDEKAGASRMCEDGGADYVKTSSGFNGNEDFYALMESLRIMKKNAPHLEMKAAGGINNYKLASNVMAAGVTKIGTSSGTIIMDQLNHVLENQKISPNQKTGPRLI